MSIFFISNCFCSTRLLQCNGKWEKMLGRSNFCFSDSFFYPFTEYSAISENLKLSSANSLNLEVSKICRLEKGKYYSRVKPRQDCKGVKTDLNYVSNQRTDEVAIRRNFVNNVSNSFSPKTAYSF